MYDATLKSLQKDLQNLEHSSLAALADGEVEEYDSLQTRIESLQQEIQAREMKVAEQSAEEEKKKADMRERLEHDRLQHSRAGIAALNDTAKKIQVWQGYNNEHRLFTYDELLQKMNAILKRKESFSVGSSYYGKLSVTSSGEKTIFNYECNNRDQKEFRLEVTSTESFELFLKTINLTWCKFEPEREHGTGQILTESCFRYDGETIVRDLFQAFADALYKKMA